MKEENFSLRLCAQALCVVVAQKLQIDKLKYFIRRVALLENCSYINVLNK